MVDKWLIVTLVIIALLRLHGRKYGAFRTHIHLHRDCQGAFRHRNCGGEGESEVDLKSSATLARAELTRERFVFADEGQVRAARSHLHRPQRGRSSAGGRRDRGAIVSVESRPAA